MSDHVFEKGGKLYKFTNAWHDRPFSEEPCPRCGYHYNDYPSNSRRDNRTPICSDCGREEAFEDMGGKPWEGEPYWTVAE